MYLKFCLFHASLNRGVDNSGVFLVVQVKYSKEPSAEIVTKTLASPHVMS